MARTRVNLFGGSAQSRYAAVNAQRTVNCYPHQPSPGGADLVLLPGPGLAVFRDYGGYGGVRGLMEGGGSLYAVVGDRFYRDGSHLGGVGGLTGPVSMVWNGYQVMIGDGSAGWVYDSQTGAFGAITDPDFPPSPGPMAVIDSYGVVTQPPTGRFYISALNDFTSWDGTDFGSAQSRPDKVVSCIADHRELWIMGEISAEVFADSGNADFPFERINGASQEVGCAAPYSLAKLDNTIFWLGKTDHGQGLVYRANGYSPQVVSTREIEDRIAGLSRVDDALAWALTWRGHPQYWLTFPAADVTLVYDALTGFWHERTGMDGGRHPANCYAFYASNHFVGDFESPIVYQMTNDPTYGGQLFKRYRQTQVVGRDQVTMFHEALEVQFEVGLGQGSGVEPVATLRWSDDNGRTWSNERRRGLGQGGQRDRRVIWRRLGRSRERVYEVGVVDAVDTAMVGAWLEASAGRT